MRRVMVFGVFDGLHDGHRSLFEQARGAGDYVIAAVADDEIVRTLKGRTPRRSIEERMEAIQDENLVDSTVPGDSELGVYEVVRVHRPDVIALGYDQIGLRKDFERHLPDFDWPIEIVMLEPHKPEVHHSSAQK